MPRQFIVAELTPERIDQALPVVQTLDPGLDAEGWRAIAPTFDSADGDRGILAMLTGSGHIRGLLCFEVREYDGERILAVSRLIGTGLMDATATAQGLVEAAEMTARHHACPIAEIDLATLAMPREIERRAILAALAAQGYHSTGQRLTRRLDPADRGRAAGQA
jgi:hypothetical protein